MVFFDLLTIVGIVSAVTICTVMITLCVSDNCGNGSSC